MLTFIAGMVTGGAIVYAFPGFVAWVRGFFDDLDY
jgi:hypothetical protein